MPAVSKAFCVTGEEAKDYMMFGCGEHVLNHASFGSPNGVLNLLKVLELVLFKGVDQHDGKRKLLLEKGLCGFASYDELYQEFLRNVRRYAEILAMQEWIEYRACAERAGFLLASALFDDCFETGKPLFDGGARYLGGTLETYGNVNVANSLFALKKLVFEAKAIKAGDLLEALKADFNGFEDIRRELLSQEKFGNDQDGVDALAAKLHSDACGIIMEQKRNVPLHSYLAVIINNEAKTIMGRFTAASADGRKAGKPMANGNMPQGGTERNGLAAMLKSMAKMDPGVHAGAVQNIMISKELFSSSRQAVQAALEAYWASGGAQAMITVTGKEDLKKALESPELYPSLMVRVGGFSARFVTLARDVQTEIASREVF
jgi:pyruvate-formate lyase